VQCTVQTHLALSFHRRLPATEPKPEIVRGESDDLGTEPELSGVDVIVSTRCKRIALSIRPRRMHEIPAIIADDRCVCPSVSPPVSLSVCLSRGSTRLHCAKTAEQIKILFVVNTLGGPRNIALDGAPDPPRREGDSMQPSPNYFGHLLLTKYNTGRDFELPYLRNIFHLTSTDGPETPNTLRLCIFTVYALQQAIRLGR